MENAAIIDLIAKQKAAGYHVITDGEFRRSYWHLDFMWGFNGIIVLVFAFLVSPIGITMLAAWMIGQMQRFRYFVQDAIYG